jgi:hypothetical protein
MTAGCGQKKEAVRDLVGPNGLADVVPTTKGRFPPSAEPLSNLSEVIRATVR